MLISRFGGVILTLLTRLPLAALRGLTRPWPVVAWRVTGTQSCQSPEALGLQRQVTAKGSPNLNFSWALAPSSGSASFQPTI